MLAEPIIKQDGINSYSISHGDDRMLIPEFYDREILDEAASAREGRPIHRSVSYVRIVFAGDKTKVIDRPVMLNGTPGGAPADPVRWPAYWAAYKNQTEQAPPGTSLLEWAPMPRSEARDLKAMKIHTVEQLAALPDTALTWLGAQSWRNKAAAWLASAADPSAVLKMQAENERQKADIEMLKKQIQDLANLKTPDKGAETNKKGEK